MRRRDYLSLSQARRKFFANKRRIILGGSNRKWYRGVV